MKRLPCLILISVVNLFLLADDSSAQKTSPKSGKEKDSAVTELSDAAPTTYAARTLTMRFGMQFSSNDNNCSNIHATIPFPTDWPEQKVTFQQADISPGAFYEPRKLAGGTMQLVIKAPSVPAQNQFNAIVTVQVEKSFIQVPKDPSKLVIAKPIPKDAQPYMGAGPYIEPEYRLIKKVAKEIKDSQPTNAWEHVEKIYDWVRDNIEYRNGKIRSTTQAMDDKYGDCEEMTGIFVAICRASNIPARCVWVPEHCYPEFFLQDENGVGHWFPCQVAGDRQFGEMKEYRPILQKGDKFKVPEKKGQQRYVSEFFTCKQKPVGPKAPDVKTIRDLGGLEEEIEALKTASPPSFSSGDGDDKGDDKGDNETDGDKR